jgi:hypothetical protein
VQEHPARKGNDPGFTQRVCDECHVRHLTPRQETIGVTPGLDAILARPGGILLYLTLMAERRGLHEDAGRFRVVENWFAAAYGKAAVSWNRPRRPAAVTVTDPDITVMSQDIGNIQAGLWDAQASDPACPPELVPDFVLVDRYYRAVSANPAAYVEYQGAQHDLTARAAALTASLLCHMARSKTLDGETVREISRELGELCRAEATGFLRYLAARKLRG